MNKVAIVTGGASGIGLEIANYMTKVGYSIVVFDIKPPADNSFFYVTCDVSNEKAVISAYEQVKQNLGTCDLLINNSGLQYMSHVEDFPLEKWNLLIGVMLTGTFLCSKTVIPSMKAKNEGRIINISSVHGKLASPYKAAYVAAKHGILGLAKVMAKELAPFNITVNSICPGFVDTPLMRDQVKSQMQLNNLSEEEVVENIFLKNQEIKKLTKPSQIAGMVEFLASENASTITGEAFNISGGWGM